MGRGQCWGYSGRNCQRLVQGREPLFSDHPSGGLSLGRRPSLEGSGVCSVFGKAHGEAGMWVMSPVALSPALAPAPSQELDPAARLQKQSCSTAGGICAIRSDAAFDGIARATATCTPVLAATGVLQPASAGPQGELELGKAPAELGLHLAPPSAPELASVPSAGGMFCFHFSLHYFLNFCKHFMC